MRFFKGYSIDHRRSIAKVYDTMQPSMFNQEDYSVEVVDVCDGSRKFFRTMDDLTDYNFTREISENEFNMYRTSARMLTEIWMHQYTGGFPSESIVLKLETQLRKYISGTLDDLKNEKATE